VNSADRVKVEVSNDELVTVRDAMRELNRLVEKLVSGERRQFVLMRHGKMVARIVPLEEVE
jgi:antitoxin (DNA-binding transcriptional repressor) of toxin-antitoxin stability system